MKKNIRKLICALLTLCLLLSLAACGNGESDASSDKSSDDKSSASDTGSMPSSAPADDNNETSGFTDSDNPGEEKVFSLETVQARILYQEDDYLAILLFDAPRSTYQPSIVDKDENQLGGFLYSRYTQNTIPYGVWLLDTPEWDSECDLDDVCISYSVSSANGDDYRLITDVPMATQDEIDAARLYMVDGYVAFAGTGGVKSTSQYFGYEILVYMFCKEHFGEIENVIDRISFFAGDGTPLESSFPGYNLEVSMLTDYVDAYFYKEDKSSIDDVNALGVQLQACDPYMVYTAPDGSSWTFPLVQE